MTGWGAKVAGSRSPRCCSITSRAHSGRGREDPHHTCRQLAGPAGFDPIAHSDDDLRRSVEWIVGQQRAIGLDIINEGELTKGGDWLAFMDQRLGGFEERPFPASGTIIGKGKDREEFAEFYRFAAERQTLFFMADKRMSTARRYLTCTSPITYTGQRVARARAVDIPLGGVESGRLLSHQHRAREPRAVSIERVLQDARRVRRRTGRGAARRVRGDRQRGLSAADRRRMAGRALGSHWDGDGTRCVQTLLHGSYRRVESCAAQHRRRARAVSPVLGAAGMGLTPTTFRSPISST
jgi:hypothetical protein